METAQELSSDAVTPSHPMRTLGLIGGMSWVSTAEYYRRLNELAHARFGGNASFPCLIHSFNFAELTALQDRGDRPEVARRLAAAARSLEKAGAAAVVIGTNTMHRHADEVVGAVDIPLIHLIDALAAEIRDRGWRKVGILGTMSTMTEPFYAGRLQNQGIETLAPEAAGREFVHRCIFDELTQNRFLAASRERFLGEIARLAEAGAEACIMGCTEIPLLLQGVEAAVPLVDSTAVHCEAAFAWSCR